LGSKGSIKFKKQKDRPHPLGKFAQQYYSNLNKKFIRFRKMVWMVMGTRKKDGCPDRLRKTGAETQWQAMANDPKLGKRGGVWADKL